MSVLSLLFLLAAAAQEAPTATAPGAGASAETTVTDSGAEAPIETAPADEVLLTAIAAPSTLRVEVDRAQFPRDLARGDAFATVRRVPPASFRFVDSGAEGAVLEVFHLQTAQGERAVHCGAEGATAGAAIAADEASERWRNCFYDSNQDGAADQRYRIVRFDPGGLALAAPVSMPPRRWSAATTTGDAHSLLYAGPAAGLMQADGRLGYAQLMLEAVAPEGAGAAAINTPRLRCGAQGDCLPLDLLNGTAIVFSRPTIDGTVHAEVLTHAEALVIQQRVRGELVALAARELAEEAAVAGAPAPPVPVLAPQPTPGADAT